MSPETEERIWKAWNLTIAAAEAAGRGRQEEDSVAFPEYLLVTSDCYRTDPSPSSDGPRIIRYRDYQLYDSKNSPMTGSFAVVSEYLIALDTRYGKLPDDRQSGRNGAFHDTLGVRNTGPFQALQIFTASVGQSPYAVPGFPNVPVYVKEMKGRDYGTLNLTVTAGYVDINGDRGQPCP